MMPGKNCQVLKRKLMFVVDLFSEAQCFDKLQWDTVQGLMGQWDTMQGVDGTVGHSTGVDGTVGHSAGG